MCRQIGVDSAAASLLLALRQSRLQAVVSVAVTACLVLTFGYFRPLQQPVSQFKAFSYYSSLPDAKVEGRSYSPLGRLDIVSASSIHLSPGLSLGVFFVVCCGILMLHVPKRV